MTTLLCSQPEGDGHRMPSGHPEAPERIEAARKALSWPRFDPLSRREAAPADLALAETVHAPEVLETLQARRPQEGIGQIDRDTFVAPESLVVAATALGAGLDALGAVFSGEADNAFCMVRPPGHHATRRRSMGFCLFNTIAMLARQAQRRHGAERVAIVDFDVHHGNGTQDIFADDPSVFYASSHEMPLFPYTGDPRETGCGNVVNVALPAGSGGELMREAYNGRILPALSEFSPDVILVSAGFDAEFRDPLAHLDWRARDFAWLTGKLMDIADRRCSNRIVSILEGGYDLDGLAAGVSAHVGMLLSGEMGQPEDEPGDAP